MLRFAAILQAFAASVSGRMTTLRTRDEHGSLTLEQVIITVALVVVAGVVVAAITAAVNGAVGGITSNP